MCGIAGIFKFNSEIVKLGDLKRMTDVIIHRGPDGEGHWINESKQIGFGHRRLAIIDLSENGKQPMLSIDGRFSITFNGEIYNYIELKQQLVSKGYKFRSESDTEILLALYDQKKEKCLADLDGMFSFAIWDEKEKVLFCARDRFGEKPFHYYIDQEQFVFGSEIKEFWAFGFERRIISDRLSQFVEFGRIDDETNLTSTFYEKILRLDAGQYMQVQLNGKFRIGSYWNTDFNLNEKQYKGSIENAAEEFLNLLTESVSVRLRSDVPVGSSLSGGLDSSSIVMLIDRLKGRRQIQNTFSARFKNFVKDEGKHIDTVIKACKNVETHYTWPDEKYFIEVFDKVNYHQDEPFGSASIVAQYAVMELAKKNKVTVLLDGQGADEYLAGYLPYYKSYLDQLFYNDRKSYKKEIIAYNSFHGQIYPYTSMEHQETIRMKFGRYRRLLLNQAMPYSDNGLKKILASDTKVGLKTLLRYADRNSMAHSTEVRLPFLSHKLVEFVFSLPNSYKLNLGWTKYVMRKSMDHILPESICWRVDKIGYEPPQNTWLNSNEIKGEIAKSAKLFGVSYSESENEPYVDSKNWRLLLASKYL